MWHQLGAHQRRTSSGRVQASKTMRAGARKVREITTAQSPSSSTEVSFSGGSFRFFSAILLLLLHELLEELVHLVETRGPELAVALEPVVDLPERLGAELVEPLLRARLHVHQPGLLEHAQVLGDLRL